MTSQYLNHMCSSVNICYSPAGRSVLGKTVLEVLGTQDRGHSFFNTDRPRLVNNIFVVVA